MIYQPDYYIQDFTWEEAVSLMTCYGRGDLLQGMKEFEAEYERKLKECDDMDLGVMEFDHWLDIYAHEHSAFNVVWEGMSQLFEKEVA